MNISDNYYEIILNELKQVQKNCNETKNPNDKLYFFSASFGILNRVLNLECHSILVFMHQVLNQLHQAVNHRLQTPSAPGSIANAFPTELWDKIFSTYGELIDNFEKKDEDAIRKSLEKLTLISYATTGNGYYLYLQKKLSI